MLNGKNWKDPILPSSPYAFERRDDFRVVPLSLNRTEPARPSSAIKESLFGGMTSVLAHSFIRDSRFTIHAARVPAS
jgi:hypothetical protein